MDFLKSQISQATTGQTTGNENSSVNNDQQNQQNQNNQGNQQQQQQQNSSSGGGGGLMGMANNALGGGESGEAKEDYLDKAVDMVQSKYLGGGDQSNESASEQAKDEMISDQIRGAYKSATGNEFFVADKN
ncbi:hypothetical protein BDY24DRAFT_413120 [Mrakia frigida]|uniref:uncharacterized protein n=1 Tax=Mrakia frigida TaxID=29902 RepID=UPI003FCBF1C0